MELGYRTFIRHALLAVVLVLVLFFIQGFQGFSVSELLERNVIFLMPWFGACLLLGYLGHRFVVYGVLKRWATGLVARSTGRSAFKVYRDHISPSRSRRRKAGKNTWAAMAGLFLKWATCSRCVAWWAGGFFSFVASLLYWPAWPAAIYFGALGASVSAAVAVFFYLRAFVTKSS